MKYLMPAIRFNIFMTILLGLVYPFAITEVSQALFVKQASGDFLVKGGQIVGSKLIAQNFEKSEYFWPRPSAISYNPLPSGGSNFSQASQILKDIVNERKNKIKAAHSEQTGEPPQDLLFASGSGLDPHISVESAQYQLQRVVRNRRISAEQVRILIEKATEKRFMGILGEPTVNVLVLNLALDEPNSVMKERNN